MALPMPGNQAVKVLARVAANTLQVTIYDPALLPGKAGVTETSQHLFNECASGQFLSGKRIVHIGCAGQECLDLLDCPERG